MNRKKVKRAEENIQEQWDNSERYNVCMPGIPKEERSENSRKINTKNQHLGMSYSNWQKSKIESKPGEARGKNPYLQEQR